MDARIIYLLCALIVPILTAPQFKLSKLEYNAMLSILKGNRPTTVVNASPVLRVTNAKPEGYVVLDLNIVESPENIRKPIPRPYSDQSRRLRHTLYRDQLNNIEPLSKRDGFVGKQIAPVLRSKRQSDDDDDYDYDYEEEEEDVRYAEELQFGLSTAGGIVGSAFGTYLDTTGQATLRLIRSLETIGTLGLGQFDNFLDMQEEKQKESTSSTSYN